MSRSSSTFSERMKIAHIAITFILLSNLMIAAPSIIGTWKSNKELTLKETRLDQSVREETKKKFEDLFGRMTITYTKSKSIARMEEDEGIEEWESITDYKIVAEAKDKLMIEWKDSETGEMMQETLHFINPNQYWIKLPTGEGKIQGREYFDRQLKAEPAIGGNG